MGVSTYIGFKCPHGHLAVNIGVTVGGGAAEPRCSICGATMIPDPHSRGATTNAYCPKCKTFAGLTTGTRCPSCGGAYTALLKPP
jgi:hypothetical protein